MLDDSSKLQVVDAPEQAKRRLPARHVVSDDRGDDRVVRE
jgi:hypothetical protein